ncbi:MAG: ferritin family protein [Methanomicrobia archaeon]|nr:ferritin family protein [Methanomicrobia archaeon]
MLEREIFSIAVKSELDSKKIYEKMAEKTSNFVLKDKLRFLAKEEEKHRKILENMFNKLYPDEDLKISEKSLVPKIDIESAEIPELLEKAMESERIEEKFYRDLAEKSEYKNILLYLADVEKGHHAILEAEHNMVMQYPDYYNKSWDTDMIHLEP